MGVGIFHQHVHDIAGPQRCGHFAQEHGAVDLWRIGLRSAGCADVAVFAGDRRGIIYVQGQKVANVPEEQILDTLLSHCLQFQDDVKSGRAKLGDKKVEIIPPDPIGELGSGWEKIAAGKGADPAQTSLTIGRSS